MIVNTHGGANRNQGAKKKRKPTDQKWAYFATEEVQQAFDNLPIKTTRQKFIDDLIKEKFGIKL